MGGESPLFERVNSYFDRQGFMRTLGARLEVVEPGRVVIGLPNADRLSQEDGFLHAGAATSVVDPDPLVLMQATMINLPAEK